MIVLSPTSSPALTRAPAEELQYTEGRITFYVRGGTGGVLVTLDVNGEPVLRDDAPQDGWLLEEITEIYGGEFRYSVRRARAWEHPQVLWLLRVRDVSSGDIGYGAGASTATMPGLTGLRASGNPFTGEVSLRHSFPAGVTRVIIRRSTFEYPSEEAGEEVYEGVPAAVTDDPDAEEDSAHYYTVFLSVSPAAPYRYYTDDAFRVAAVKQAPLARHYVYERWVPPGVRRKDKDGYLRKHLDVVQAMLSHWNVIIGKITDLRDPDAAPAGRVGEPEGQTSILFSAVRDLGGYPEQTFESGALRRLYAGLSDVLERKGTPGSFRDFTRVFALWDADVEVTPEAVCGHWYVAATATLDSGAVAATVDLEASEDTSSFGTSWGSVFGGG